MYDPDVIGITETWLHEHVNNAEISLKGYTTFRNDRQNGRKGGGVILYVRTSLQPTEYQPMTTYPEHTWCSVKDKMNKVYYIGVVYRTNNDDIYGCNLSAALCNMINEVGSKNIILMGDFNYSEIDWSIPLPMPGAPPDTVAFLDCIESKCLSQHVKVPTRGKNVLDLILTKDPDILQDMQIIENLAGSDHNMITWNVQVDIQKNAKNNWCIFDYNKGDYDAIRDELRKVEWNNYLTGDTENRWQQFKKEIHRLQKLYIPTKSSKVQKPKKTIWINRRAIKAVDKKRRIFRKYKDIDHPAVKSQNRTAKRELNRARKNFEKKLAENIKSDTKSFYAYIRSMSTSRVKPTTLKQNDGTETTSVEQTCNEFNQYFSSVFTNETLDNITTPLPMFHGTPEEKLTTISINAEMVHKSLGKMRIDKAPGADDMMPRLLVEIADSIVEPLCNIYNSTLTDGVVPMDWRRANVSPIHKKGSRVQAENYRPISLTSQLCKVFEFIMREALVSHLEKLHLLYESQHGFRRGRSCLTNLLTFLEKVTKAIDDGLSVDVVYLDLAKAFDKVPHERLIRKLTSHGIEGDVRRWLENWLKGRQQRVCIDGYLSAWRYVTSGVPQ